MMQASPKLTVIRLGNSTITLFPTVKGLLKERRPVRQAILETSPDAVALPVSIESLKGLRALHRGMKQEFFLSHYEEIYALKLLRYGKVSVPPPSYTEAYAVCDKERIPVKAIDMDEEEYANAFCDNISGTSLMYHSVRWRWLKRKGFKADTPEEFAILWDRSVTALKGFRNLENQREAYMARQLGRLAKRYKNVLAVLEIERLQGIVRRLREGPREEPAAPATVPKDEEE
jgi:hypothetical protein